MQVGSPRLIWPFGGALWDLGSFYLSALQSLSQGFHLCGTKMIITIIQITSVFQTEE